MLPFLWNTLITSIVSNSHNVFSKAFFFVSILKSQHFLLSPQCFPYFPNKFLFSQKSLSCCLQMLWIWSLKFCCLVKSYPITRRQILDSSKLKDFADDNLKFEENGRKLFKPVGNTVGKGEIAHYEQLLLFPQCFQKAPFPGASIGVIVWEWVKNSVLYKV